MLWLHSSKRAWKRTCRSIMWCFNPITCIIIFSSRKHFPFALSPKKAKKTINLMVLKMKMWKKKQQQHKTAYEHWGLNKHKTKMYNYNCLASGSSRTPSSLSLSTIATVSCSRHMYRSGRNERAFMYRIQQADTTQNDYIVVACLALADVGKNVK